MVKRKRSNGLRFDIDIAREFHEGGISIIHRHGRNADLDAAEDISNGGGDYTFPAAAQRYDVVSDSAEDGDDANAATGSITYGTPVDDDTVDVDGETFTKKPPAAAASGTITYGAPDNGDGVEVAGEWFFKVASNPAGGQFTTIAQLTALIDALADVTATDDGSTIAIVAAANGTAGNSITLSVDGDNTGTLAVSGATLTGGVADPGANEFVTIAGLTALVNALATVTATNNGTTITITAATAGTAGNSITLAKGVGNSGTLDISGATLTGGDDANTIGALTLRVTGTDANGDAQTEDVTLGGTVAVRTAASFLRINGLDVLTCGSTGSNVGTITATGVTDSTVDATIRAGEGTTAPPCYTVPADNVLTITALEAGALKATSGTIDVGLWIRDGGSAPWRLLRTFAVKDADQRVQLDPPIVADAGADLKIRATPSTGNMDVVAGYSGYLVQVLGT